MNQEELKTLVAQMLRELAPQPGAPGEGQRVPAHGIGIQADPQPEDPGQLLPDHFGN